MKVSILHVVFILAVPTFVFANPPFGGGGTTRIVKDLVGGGATIYHSDGTTSRYDANPLGGGGTIRHTGGGTTRVVNDLMGGGATIYDSNGSTSRYDANPLGGGGTIHHTGGGTSRVVNDLMGGGATIYNSNGSTSRYDANPLGGGGTIHSFGGALSPYGSDLDVPSMGANASGFQSSSGVYSSPSSFDYDVGGAGIDMPLSTYQSGSSSRPVIEGYRYIGDDNPSVGDMVENAAIQAALYYGAKALADGLRDEDEERKLAAQVSTDRNSSFFSAYKDVIVYVAFGICALLALGVALVVLFIPTLIINMFFGRECDIVRDSKGKLVSVKMPKSIIILVVVTYVVFALPYGSLFDTEKWFGTEQLGGCIFILACWSVFMLIPVCLHLGKNLARGVVAGICIMTIIIVVMVFFAGGEIGWRGWMIGIVSILVSRFVIALLLLPQSIEWFSAKKELSRASAGKTANVFYWTCRKIGRLFGAVSPRQKTGREAPAGKAER